MASFFLLVFFLLLHLPPLHSTEEEMRYAQKCPPTSCGSVGMIGFPFTNKSHPECGPFTVECHNFLPWIRFGEGRRSYKVLEIVGNNVLLIHDDKFPTILEYPRCEFSTNLAVPSSSFFSVKIPLPSSQTFYKCNSTYNVHPPPDVKTISCGDANIYYNPVDDFFPPNFSGCSTIQLSKYLNLGPNRLPNGDDLFSIVTPEFVLEVHVYPECLKCYEKGSQCKARTNGKFYCKKGLSKNQKIGIGVGCSIGVLCLVLVTYQGKRRGIFSKMLAKRAYSAPFTRSDVEARSVYFGVPVYSYSELEEATNNFDAERELGDGGYGTVYYGKLRDGREVAIKRLYEHNYKQAAQFMNEVEILTRLRHRNLVSLYGCTSRCSRELLLVYEYIPNGTVADHIHGDQVTPGSPPWPTRMSIAIETASALAYLHASEIIHRDVKTNNILLDHNFCVKVADFGTSRLFPFNVTHVSTAPQGTPGYVDPEYHQRYQLSTKSDVYSFGVVLIELISSLPAVDLARHEHDINLASLALKRIERSEYQELIDSHLGFDWDKEVQRMTISVSQLAFRCIQHDKELRPSMDEVLEVLTQIQSKNDAPNDRGKAIDDDGITNIKPPTSQDSDEVGLLKTTPMPPSPNSVIDDWTSSSTTPNVSS